MIKKGDELEVTVSALSSEGKGIAKLDDGFVVFIPNALPGDILLVKIFKKKSSFAEGRVLKMIQPSADRNDAGCKHFGTCGGCKIQNYKYEKQLEYKTKVVKDALEKIGDFDNIYIPPATGSPEIFYYRNKMEFTFSDDKWWEERDIGKIGKSNFALGLHIPKFHSKILDIEECYLQSKLTPEILNFTREFFKEKSISPYSTKSHSGFLRFLVIRECQNTDDKMINLITSEFDNDLMLEYSNAIKENFQEVTTFINGISSKKAQVAFSEEEHILFGNGTITEKLTNSSGKTYSFKISSNSFFQTNTKQAENLFNIAMEFGDYNKSDSVLDLYCGAGSISIFISKKVKKILGVELIEDAVFNAKENSILNQVENVEFIVSDIKDFLIGNEGYKNYNKLILDPPRSGLHPKICEVLSECDFENIVYVSCNPHTQARDLKIICSKGKYKIEKVQPVDMFPHTYHVENVVKLVSVSNEN